MLRLPNKEIIVNDDSQVRLLEDDGTAYQAADATPSAGGFILEGFAQLIFGAASLGPSLNLLKAATRLIKDTPSAGAAEITTYVLTQVTAIADCVFRLKYESLDLTPTEQQGQPLEKRYQIPVQTTVDGVGAAIAAAINADKSAPVTVVYTAGSDTLTLTAKVKGVQVNLFSKDYVLPTKGTTTAAALPLNTYDYLKNINWAKNVDVDRNLNWIPLPGASYNSYYFEVLANSVADMGDVDVASQVQNQSNTGFKIWVKTGLTLDTALGLLLTDMNV